MNGGWSAGRCLVWSNKRNSPPFFVFSRVHNPLDIWYSELFAPTHIYKHTWSMMSTVVRENRKTNKITNQIDFPVVMMMMKHEEHNERRRHVHHVKEPSRQQQHHNAMGTILSIPCVCHPSCSPPHPHIKPLFLGLENDFRFRCSASACGGRRGEPSQPPPTTRTPRAF